MDLISISHLEFFYPGAAQATVSLADLQIHKKEKIFLFGPSGCGKTTLLEILSGVLVPQKGSVRILGNDLAQMTASARDQFRGSHIGYIFQSFNLIPYLNVEDNITLPFYLNRARQKKTTIIDMHQDVEKICEALGILNLRKNPVTELSVGQQQRVAAARALLGSPELILADEPTSALDYDHREKFIRLLFELCDARGTTLIFVSHDKSLQALFDRSLSLPELNRALK